MLCGLALRLGEARCNEAIAELDSAITRIAVDGERVGLKLEQLELMAEAERSRDDFARLISSLDQANPGAALSYSQVELTDEGAVRLRGQADSLALPFELPQRLEDQAGLRRVSLRDAGQAQRGEGSVTEFRMDAELVREAGR